MNQSVFGTEMVLLTFITGVIQILALFIHFGVLVSKPYSRANWRFLFLISLFVCYNIFSGLFPDRNIHSINLFIQNVLAFGSGIILACYYFYFLVKELEINQRSFFNIKFLFLSLVSSFLLLFVLTYFLYGDFKIARKVFIVPPVVIALYFCFNTIREIRIKSAQTSIQGLYRSLNIAGKFGIMFMATMPIIVSIGDYQLINNGLVNISFFLIWFSYYTLLLIQAKNERELNDCKVNTADKNCISEIGLTPRELEVAAYILKGETYNDLAERMYISHKTVSKHASNIFKKAECCNREEFLLKYLKV
ncbi:response regulator transcription factor [Crocinitomix algicola]|uniref:response regulator transcription factor n=1 Tax=Crocinitomix algicola TaxID=1740263 RepID=UPI0008347F51|nr:helix-turn-helix transcriptional regulator [Crocinitomix algicola]